MGAELRILDIVNTDHAALHFLLYRANWINAHTEFRNDIVCSPGPHLSRVQLEGGVVTAMDIPRGLSPRGMAGLLARLTRHMRANRYTIVHTHNSVTGAVGRMAARLARVPLVIHTTHGFHFHEDMSALRRWPYVTAARLLARLSDLLLFQNREEFEDLRRLDLRPRQGGYFVGNGIDLAKFARRPGLPENPRPVILCVARLEPVKNQEMLFRALEIVRARFDAEVWLVGDGPCQASYEADLRRRGLTDAVRFLGYRYDIPELTAAADVCVLTSLKEGIPRSLVQAMAVGVPVVATDVKGTREVVVDGQSGFLVPLHDAAALAERLERLLGSAELRREIGARASAWVREHFDEAEITKRLADIYRRALKEQGIAVPRYTPAAAEISWAEHRPA